MTRREESAHARARARATPNLKLLAGYFVLELVLLRDKINMNPCSQEGSWFLFGALFKLSGEQVLSFICESPRDIVLAG